ncbi:uncharacterized protein [Coffea arabica]|uniref:C2H2-type domain-containing protein n=1 Tax=Coffea arabica TaxID=13443 RepID=A0A6P6W0Q4_COFAR
MDCTEDQPPKFKHYCRICKKGFMCGRALGGHMRAHGIGDEGGSLDDDDVASDWEDKFGGADRTCRRMYQLRTNPNRLKSCRICENCGKEFASWKSFLEHGKCSSDDAESLVSSPGSDGEYEGERKGCQWSKRKRSLRTKVGSFGSAYPSSEDEDLLLARCLVDLANARFEVEPEESCASASKEEERRINPVTAYFNTPLIASRVPLDKPKGASKGLFECKACKKVFNSHQALGGHRASHKKVKGCFAAKQDQQDDSSLADDDVTIHDEFFPSKSPSSLQFEQGPTMAGASRRKSKVHECTICHRVFSTGQALGGHKRCHWITSNSQETSSLVKLQFNHDHMDHQILHQGPPLINKSETLDLNIPATQGDHELLGILRPQNPLSFEVSTDIRLHTWTPNLGAETKCDSQNCHHQNDDDQGNENDRHNDSNINKNNINCSNGPIENADDEADSKVELAKLSDLKDINLSGNSSQWLQVGIGSTARWVEDFVDSRLKFMTLGKDTAAFRGGEKKREEAKNFWWGEVDFGFFDMEKHRCKLCFRSFANGRALGGHMRSHMMNLCAATKAKQEFIKEEHEEEEVMNINDERQISEEFESVPSSSFSSSSSSEDEEINPKKKVDMVMDQEFCFGGVEVTAAADSVVVQDRESETESSKNPICRRSKRVRKSRVSDAVQFSGYINDSMAELKKPKSGKQGRFSCELPFADAEPVSSISDTTTEEVVAYCLMMLSRDKWKKEDNEEEAMYGGEEVEEEEAEEGKADHEEPEKQKKNKDAKSQYCHDFGVVKVTKSRTRGKYRCETCNKAFRSYQALGGHRASHKRIKAHNSNSTEEEVAGKIHECPICYRIFSSGQALGGHKRSHVMGAAAAAAAAAATTHVSIRTSPAAKPFSRFGEAFIDLNLPAPVDDDEISQIELSAVSDAEFVNPFKQ